MRKRLGLSVGINDYPKEPLTYAVADTARCCEALQRIHFECLKCIDADHNKFKQYLGMFCEQITEEHDFLVFNFNGHCKVIDGDAVLVFRDGEEEAMKVVVEKLVLSKGRHDAVILCLMNCCRGISKECADKLVKPGNRSAWGRSLVTIWATPFGYPAEEIHNSAGCSTFMRAFAQCIGHELSLAEMYDEIEKAVTSHSLNSIRPIPQQPCLSAQKLPQRFDLFVAEYPSGKHPASTYGRQQVWDG